MFTQLAERLKSAHVNDPVVILRSSDASNLKTVLKKLIRVATNRKDDDGDELQTKVHDVCPQNSIVAHRLMFSGSETARL